MINLEDKKMTNNKKQTGINEVEYIIKVNQFAKENNTDKPRQQTAVEWLLNAIETKNGEEFSSYYTEFIEQAKEIEKERTIQFCIDWYFNGTVMMKKIDVKTTIEQHYNETYEGGEQ
jgi:lipopolysaccharide biosynthesis protein